MKSGGAADPMSTKNKSNVYLMANTLKIIHIIAVDIQHYRMRQRQNQGNKNSKQIKQTAENENLYDVWDTELIAKDWLKVKHHNLTNVTD